MGRDRATGRVSRSDQPEFSCAEILAQLPAGGGAFRLPTETEWEYAAHGGLSWRDGFRFSGSGDIDAVAWYDRKHGDHTQPVAEKAPNQLGIYDMSGNVWEWCQDVFTRDVSSIPGDGTPYVGLEAERVLRGGCFHNWAIHCTVSKRYEIGRDYHDGCIGFRIMLSVGDHSRRIRAVASCICGTPHSRQNCWVSWYLWGDTKSHITDGFVNANL